MLINNSNFLLNEVPNFNPFSHERFPWWKEQKRRIVEGYWVGGKWMPGNLYQYVNFWHIHLSKDDKSKSKKKGKPFLRDLEWEKSYIFQEAKGFSGFELDVKETCNRGMAPENLEITKELDPLVYETFKDYKYVDTRQYLRRVFKRENMGRPLYENQASNVIDVEARTGGKALAHGSILYYEDRKGKIEDAKVGDRIYGADGKLTTVTGVFPQGTVPLYRIILKDNRSVVCCEDHLWYVYNKNVKKNSPNSRFQVKSLKEFKDNYYTLRKNSGWGKDIIPEYKFAIPIGQAIEYSKKEVLLSPYMLGVWLGDGNKEKFAITTADPEIEIAINDIAAEYECKVNVDGIKGQAATYSVTKGYTGLSDNPLLHILDHYNLRHNKHIPSDYLHGSVEQRMGLLRGLMDTDGFADNRHTEFYSSSPILADDFEQLVGGLGIAYRRTIKETTHKPCHRFSLYTDKHIFNLPRKQKFVGNIGSLNAMSKYSKSFIVDIERVGEGEAICIRVDNKDSLFLTDNHVVTHNSYFAANNIGHNFITDGATNYAEYLQARKDNQDFASETLVGAYDSKWSADLLSKVRFGLENLEGGVLFQGIYYPCPISRNYGGSWKENEFVESSYLVKTGGHWVTKGTGTKIQHRTFRNNPFAAAGTRPNEVYIEEIGFMKNLVEAQASLKDCTMDGDVKFGFVWMLGTGGDMEGGATEAAKEIFFNPGDFDCLEFDDIYEGRGKIGLFIPAHMTLNRYRDSEGVVIKAKAVRAIEIKRDKARKANNPIVYNKELINKPEKPSEAFLLETNNIFPIADIGDHLGYLESMQHDLHIRGEYGDFSIDEDDKVKWQPDLTNKLQPNKFPLKKGKQEDGCVIIWEHPPEGEIPAFRYVAATDPYDQDRAPNTDSVGSTLVMKLFDIDKVASSFTIVAEYSGRPRSAREHHEKVRRLLMYYNARDLYENERNTLKMHFEHKHSLYLLMETPTVLKATVGKATVKARGNKGIHMTAPIREELEIYTRDYLEGKTPDNKMYLHTIKSIPLLRELKEYNLEGNFDRCIALFLLILAKEQLHRIIKSKNKKIARDRFFDRRMNARAGEDKYKPRVDIEDEEEEAKPAIDRRKFIQEIQSGDRKPLIPGMFKKGNNQFNDN